tara:strand:+ start:120 stop:329 length:210 start_codon:yes stop_codon:yes gene_type:complete
MRPYKIPRTRTWVDLDTIQSINEPFTWLSQSTRIAWTSAFRDGFDFAEFEFKDKRYFSLSLMHGVGLTI